MAPDTQHPIRRWAVRTLKTLVLIAVGIALASCRTVGDFGRQKPSYFYDEVVPGIKQSLSHLSDTRASEYPLTRAEQELRARALTIVEMEGPSAARTLDQSAAAYGIKKSDYQYQRAVTHTTGSNELTDNRYPRPPHVLLAEIALEIELLGKFEAIVVEVYTADEKRLKSLRRGGDVPAGDVIDVTARVRENRMVVSNTLRALHNRIDDYENEANRSALVHPSDKTGDVKNAIGRYANRVKRFEKKIRILADPDGVKHDPDLFG